MRLIFGLVLLIGLALAGGAVYMAQTYIGSYEQALEAERSRTSGSVPLVKIYLAKRTLSYGEPITPEDVYLAQYPRESLPEGTYSASHPLYVENEERRVVLRDIEMNEAILAVKLSEPGAEAGLTSRLEKGQRAFTIEVDVASGVSGFLRPGDRVEVYWTGRPPGTDPAVRRGDVTRLIETNVRLIAIDQNSNSTQPGQATIARTVTVAATPTQVASLATAQTSGRLTLSLMGLDEEDAPAAPVEVDMSTILGQEAEVQTVEVEKPTVCTMRMRRGSEIVNVEIPCTN